MNALITPNAIAALCKNVPRDTVAIEVVPRTGSTNADLLARLSGAPDLPMPTGPTLLVALQQDAGRGRAGRSWHSDAASLTFSLAWRFRLPVAALVGLPLAVGVALADALAARGIDVGLKWPNDVLRDGRKLAGILIETVSGGSLLHQEAWAVVGIGINLEGPPCMPVGPEAAAPTEPTLPAAPDAMARAVLPAADRNALMACLLDTLVPALACFEEQGFTPFMARWNALHVHAGEMINILDRGQVVHSGRTTGVDASGRLLLETALGPVAVLAGDVSLRPVPEARDAAAD